MTFLSIRLLSDLMLHFFASFAAQVDDIDINKVLFKIFFHEETGESNKSLEKVELTSVKKNLNIGKM